MKQISDKTGTFPFRPWYEDGEIEELMESHLSQYSKIFGETCAPHTPIEKFAEFYLPEALGIEVDFDNYADVEKVEGPGVMGVTYFYPDHLDIKIDRKLTEKAEDEKYEGRYNITVAHEATHGLIHSQLFVRNKNQFTLFREPKLQKIKCLYRDIDSPTNYDGRWWEFQANQGMSALKMPRKSFLKHFEVERNAYGKYDNYSLLEDAHLFKAIVGYLARTFKVSKKAAEVRLSQLGQVPNLSQGHLYVRKGFERVNSILRRSFGGR